ncbi:hypothetical protein HNP60_000699 [Sphingobium sp. B1D3A]|uniref:Uncharacterized protein n=1 Tax=Sphingobium lignivorans TaxID=2735886 RepID=A0ABR6NBR0_9SPHN|nr:hypothetical protein [Sphingobium lignivorans]
MPGMICASSSAAAATMNRTMSIPRDEGTVSNRILNTTRLAAIRDEPSKGRESLAKRPAEGFRMAR